MRHTETVIVGAGQAGLATSAVLTERGREHVVLERGRLAERWRSERWDSLRLLTPNWMSRLPGYRYTGPDPEGFMTCAEVISYFEAFARSFEAPVLEESPVRSVRRIADRYRVETDQEVLSADHVVIATGHAAIPSIPGSAAALDPSIHQLSPTSYRRPEQLPDGGVLVVGASASGAQIADELRRAGREVVLAVGAHRRIPRRYRGLDIMWWLHEIGALARTVDEISGFDRHRREPSLQLVGRADAERLDLGTLADRGVRLAGRLCAVDGTRVRFAGDLPATVAGAELGLGRLLSRIEEHAARTGLASELAPPDPPPPLSVATGPTELDLVASGIRTVLWATGFRRAYPWLEVPVLDARGEIRQRRGVTPAPGLYVVGLWFQHRRDASFIDGVRHDARTVVDHLINHPERSLVAA